MQRCLGTVVSVTPDRPKTIGVSIPIPSPHGEFLQQQRAGFGDPAARRIPAHITLLPPTDVDRQTYAAYLVHCANVARERPPFEVVLRGTGTFRPLSDVVFIQVSRGVSDCEGLEMSLRSGPVQRSLEFYYHPHVTIAHNVGEAALDRAFSELAGYGVSFTVKGFDLFEKDDHDVWRAMHHFDLQGCES